MTRLAVLLDDEIRQRLTNRRWYRNWRRTYMHRDSASLTRYADMERDNDVVLRALLELRRRAKSHEDRCDPVTFAKWQEERERLLA